MQGHLVGCAEIELVVSDTALAEELSARVSALREPQIAPILDSVCSELDEALALYRIDRLEVDLGTVPCDDFDCAFADRLRTCLHDALAAALHSPECQNAARAAPLELVEIFARTGNLPWWATSRDAEVVSRQVSWLARHTPQALLAFVRTLADDIPAQLRLARHLDEEALTSLVLGALPDQTAGTGAEIVASFAIVKKWLNEAPVANARSSAHGLLAGRVLAALASHEPRSVTEWMRELVITLLGPDARSAAVAFDGLGSEIPSLLLEAMARPEQQARSPVGLRRDGLHVDGTNDDEATPREPASLAPARPAHTARQTDAVLGAHARRPPEVPAPLAKVPAVHAVQSADSVLHEEIASPAELPRKGAPIPRDSRAKGVSQPGTAVPIGQTPLASPPGSTRLGPAAQLARKQALERIDVLQVEDAGLVVVWPFLDRFFFRTGLLDEQRRFLDEEASMTAMSLLAVLAFGDPEPPEFRLPLAKVLCGLPADSEFVLEQVPTREQLDECDRLLAAVLEHAPVLAELAIPDFRANFLQRPGGLEVCEGSWLLRVERRSHDVLLADVPWSWDWLKLPWMPNPLRVEW